MRERNKEGEVEEKIKRMESDRKGGEREEKRNLIFKGLREE